MLKQLDHIPSGLLDLDAKQLHDVLGGPTLIHLEGRREPALFISVLMHGNETTGWDAISQLLKKYCVGAQATSLPRSLMLFIANTNAAKHSKRFMPGQPDYNRVWPGSEIAGCAETRMMQEVVDIVSARGVFASIDVHNNTGLNPHYACVNRLDTSYLHLATLFSRTVVYFTKPNGVQSKAMSELCPAVTLECGKIEQQYGAEHACDYLDACLHLSQHPQHAVADHDIDLFHTTAIVKVPKGINFGYHGEDLDLSLETDLERYNFRELNIGTLFGKTKTVGAKPLVVTDENGDNAYNKYFESHGDEICTRLPVMPSMLTPDLEVIRQDCLCYLMERYHRPDGEAEH
jgi:succinylglutamate desuccinylase